MHGTKPRMLALTSLAVTLLFHSWTGSGHAQVFSATLPTECHVGKDTLNWYWDATGWGNVELDWADLTRYHHNQTTVRHFIANSRVGSVDFWIARQNIQANDLLRIRQFGHGIQDEVQLGVPPNPVARWLAITSGSLEYPIDFTFTTDGQFNNNGFRFEQVRFCRTNETPFVKGITTGERHMGILFNTNDVIYRSISGPNSGRRLHITTWGGNPAVAGMDIYVRCNALPTTSNYLRRSNSMSPNDFLYVTNAECGPTDKVNIAINSRSGGGAFNLVAQRHGLAMTMNYAIEAPTSLETNAVIATIESFKRFFYGATEGQILLENIHLWRKAAGTIPDSTSLCYQHCASNSCDGCFVRETGRAVANNLSFVMHSNEWTQMRTLAHEVSHTIVNTEDEYQDVDDVSVAYCGHSLAGMLSMPNFCIDDNHLLDPVGPPPPIVCSEIWGGCVTDYLTSPPPTTPDMHLYENHPLNGTSVILH